MARHHTKQSDQILSNFSGSDAHLTVMKSINPWICAAVRKDWQT